MEKWQIELHGTPLWLLQAFGIVVLGIALAVGLLSFTRFGRQFWQMTRPCLSRRTVFWLVLLLTMMLLLLLTEVRLNVLNTFFYNGLYSALQKGDASAFWFFALINAAVVGLRTLNDVVNEYLDRSLAIKWSEKLNRVLVDGWLADKAYYRLQTQQQRPDNIDQRIQQDAQDFISTTITFIRGMIDSVVSAVEFTVVLWGLSGILYLLGMEIPRGMVFFVFMFVLVSTLLAMWIGRPLIRMNFDNERYNGNYRYSLIRVRDHAESIAFYGGEHIERQNLNRHFADIIRNRWRIARQSVALNGFNSFLTQGVQLLPLMLQAPRFFAGQATIGDMHQTVQAFNRLQRALSFFRNFYEEFTAYRARLERLSGFLDSLPAPEQQNRPDIGHSDDLSLNGVALYRRDGTPLLENVSLHAGVGDAVLIKGPSGCGKTSLLRALAGLWPFGSRGRIRRPEHRHILFVPQRPYVPQGRLRDAIAYPDIDPQHPQLEATLRHCRLDYLLPKLDDEDDWQHRLSPGELQRIAFVRIFLSRPQVILMDEATAALDEDTEAALYRRVREELPHSIIVSIGHRGTLAAFHNQMVTVA
ncbi:putative ATP-binding cassette transporter [Neisseria sp. HSC-16F19]|nr:ABC transporter ATP-binding protein/permease [Neisseria sp. HSC-16F19]MCP2041945.1 putative ATP-binding cassette transporter [Neisseria sp. HSC-16F19]